MRCRLSYLSIAFCMVLLSQPVNAFAASAVSVPPEARDAAAAAAAAAQDILDKEQEARERTEAELYVSKALSEITQAELKADEAEKLVTRSADEADKTAVEAQAAAAQAKEAAERFALLSENAKQADAAAAAAYAHADGVEASLQAKEAALAGARPAAPAPALSPPVYSAPPPVEDSDELLKMEKEIKVLEKAQKDAELARTRNEPMITAPAAGGVDWSEAETAHARAEWLDKLAADADKKAEQAGKVADAKTAAAEAAESKAADARQALADAEIILADAREYVLQSRQYALQVKTDLEHLLWLQAHPKGAHYFAGALNYYSWHGAGNSGYQLVQPLSYGYWQKALSYNFNTKFVTSRNNTAGAGGRASSFTDTTFTIAKSSEKGNLLVDYSLEVNIPTGKSALSWPERYAMMNEDLVEVSQLGKGWQFAPGVDMSWRNGKEDTWTVGTRYTFANSYDPTADIPGDNISPGGEWRSFLRWQHAGQAWQFVGELINTSTAVTKIANGDSYNAGDQWEYRLTYSRKLPRDQRMMFYYWREHQKMNDIVPAATTNAIVHYAGTMWSRKLDGKRTMRITLDMMKTDGDRFTGISNYYDAFGNPQYTAINVKGRTKYTLGLGIDFSLNEKSSLSIDLQTFTLKDGESTAGLPSARYNGFNIFTKYSINI